MANCAFAAGVISTLSANREAQANSTKRRPRSRQHALGEGGVFRAAPSWAAIRAFSRKAIRPMRVPQAEPMAMESLNGMIRKTPTNPLRAR
jgi:hypothetical protein